ncbi:uncharacterized protein LOC133817326 [Humulus lupulus]|uniref:uncharacterized protein LOC133817326 n=1 Tax=Humulus lupulus TaxID=3486 RepID=UPI002B40300B|nr:uncharacterized protein LOC133817326 [Humulus lupulus]
MNGVKDDAIRLRLFPFSLRDRSKSWLNSLQTNSITTWQDFAEKFLAKFFPPSKAAKLRGEINNFYQLDGESLYDAWKRFKELQRKCPHHGIEKLMLVHNFYNGLCGTTRAIIDAASGGAFMSKSDTEAHEFLEDMAMNNHQWSDKRATNNRKGVGVHELDAITTLTTQVASLSKQLQQTTVSANAIQMHIGCEICGGPHPFDQCTAVGPQNNVPMDQAQIIYSESRNASGSIGKSATKHTSINLLSNTEVNPKEQCNAISLRGGKELEESVEKSASLSPKMVSEKEGKVEEKVTENLEKNKSPKRKLEEYETIALTEECSAILQKKLPPKLKDPATEIPTCCRVDVITEGASKVEVTKRKAIAQVGSRTVHHRLKRFVSGKAQLLHEWWKVPPIYNNKKRGSTHDTMALKDVRD